MRTISIEPNFRAWRERARALLIRGVEPEFLLWEDGSTGERNIFQDFPDPPGRGAEVESLKISRDFLALAELVACHRSGERWSMLYRVAWRLTHGGERNLLDIVIDGDVRRLGVWAAAVRRDRHKMKAFVRFRKVGERVSQGLAREQFVAWFEPEHHIVELTAPFFATRFTGMDWSILTPLRCAHWDGTALHYAAGINQNEAPRGADDLEDYWRSYYSHIFNPARLKLKAMEAEMPKKYWRNLPEASLIAKLKTEASLREQRMIEAPESARAHVSQRLPAGLPEPATATVAYQPEDVLRRAESLELEEIRQISSQCVACPLHQRATQVVFGEGPPAAEIMIVGEQPGDAEDLCGRPFAGPAGRLLDKALTDAGIDRASAYLTNTVKHFKWKRQGKRRLHQTPSSGEISVCKPWVLAEILKVRPRILVCLGTTAVKALIRPDFALLHERGLVSECVLAERVIATVHPSYVLRLPDGKERDGAYERWLADLRLVSKGAHLQS